MGKKQICYYILECACHPPAIFDTSYVSLSPHQAHNTKSTTRGRSRKSKSAFWPSRKHTVNNIYWMTIRCRTFVRCVCDTVMFSSTHFILNSLFKILHDYNFSVRTSLSVCYSRSENILVRQEVSLRSNVRKWSV